MFVVMYNNSPKKRRSHRLDWREQKYLTKLNSMVVFLGRLSF